MEKEAAGSPSSRPRSSMPFSAPLRMADDEAPRWENFLRLLGRTLTEPSEFIPHLSRPRVRLRRHGAFQGGALSLPAGRAEAEIVWRFHFMLGATSYAIAGTDALRLVTDWQIEEPMPEDRADRLLPRLMSFLLGGLQAPAGRRPSKAKQRPPEERRPEAIQGDCP